MTQTYYGGFEILEPNYNYNSQFEEEKRRHIHDRIQKNLFEAFGDEGLKLIGLDLPPISGTVAREILDQNGNVFRLDFAALLRDISIVHLEFQTTTSRYDSSRFINYNCLLHEREQKKKVRTVAIYSADVKEVDINLSTGTVNSDIKVVMLADLYDRSFLPKLKKKIQNGESLTEQEIANATLLPLMQSDKIKLEQAIELLKLADEIKDPYQRQLLAGAVIGLSKTYLNEEEYQKMEEEFTMISVLEQWEDEITKVAHENGREKGREEKAFEIAKKLLMKNISVLDIMETTGLTETKIMQLKSKLSHY